MYHTVFKMDDGRGPWCYGTGPDGDDEAGALQNLSSHRFICTSLENAKRLRIALNDRDGCFYENPPLDLTGCFCELNP